ncbi:hypothetical protein ACFXO9_26735 [Nocardia tengchongensis]|uniref:hypothetical protein n=1 Tax=Nocardia tengchongensis TaxID=2055889 RepID=UPI0036B74544
MATVTFVVPPSWNSVTPLSELTCDAPTVREALAWFTERYPDLSKRYATPDGEIAPWALVTLNQIDVRTLRGLETTIDPRGGELQIIASLMGG